VAQPGGHADGDDDLVRVAQKELFEETGIESGEASSRIFDIDIHDIPAYGKMPEHQHFDVRFFVLVDDSVQPIGNHESHEVSWHRIDSIGQVTTEESIARMVSKTLSL
jgi:8-oxo-dGTP pyrophosphatase MutT (NUDIX family)